MKFLIELIGGAGGRWLGPNGLTDHRSEARQFETKTLAQAVAARTPKPDNYSWTIVES